MEFEKIQKKPQKIWIIKFFIYLQHKNIANTNSYMKDNHIEEAILTKKTACQHQIY